MLEQRELWRAKESRLLKEFSQVYRQLGLGSEDRITDKTKETLLNSKEKYALISLKTGEFTVRQDTQTPYQFGFDGARFLELHSDKNHKYNISTESSPINETILVSRDTHVMNDLKLFLSVKDINIDSITEVPLKLVQGVPGCGKTTFILNNYKTGDLVLFPTRDSTKDFRTRFSQLHPKVDKTFTIDTFKTLHSYIINSTEHLRNGGSYQRLIVDEALMLHAGEILYAAALSGVAEVLLIGDIKQIPYINRIEAFEVKYYDITKIATLSHTLNLSYRCTRRTTTLLSKHYKLGMKTCSNIDNDLQKQPFTGLDDLKIDKEKYKVLVFKQSEKQELQKIGLHTSTIHEFQGKQAEHIAIIRITKKTEEIYNSEPHCLVAMSRHTKSLLYITPDENDTLSKWITEANNFSQKDLQNHYQSPGPSLGFHLIPSSQSNHQEQILATKHTDQTNHHHFLAKPQQPKERDKTQRKYKPRTLWNSGLMKIKHLLNKA